MRPSTENTTFRVIRPIILLSTSLAFGCSDETVPRVAGSRTITQEINFRTDQIVSTDLHTSFDTFTAFSEMNTWAAIGTAFDAVAQGLDSMPSLFPSMAGMTDPPPPEEPPPPGDEPPPPREDPPPPTDGEPGPDSGGIDADTLTNDLTTWLAQEILTEENLSAQTQSSATYAVSGEAFCTSTEVCTRAPCTDTSDPACYSVDCVQESDQACIDSVNSLNLAVQVTLVDSDSLDLALLVGSESLIPVTFELRPDRSVADLDLGALWQTLQLLEEGASQPQPSTFVQLEGKVRFELNLLGELALHISVSLLEPLQLEWVIDDVTQETLIVTTAAGSEIVNLQANGIDQVYVAALSIPTVDLSLPLEFIVDAATPDRFSVHLPGIDVSVDIASDVEPVILTGLGLGNETLTVHRASTRIFALDINPTSGRHFDLTVTPTADQTSASVMVVPEFDLNLDFNLLALIDLVPDIETHLQDDLYQFVLTGLSGASVLPIPPDDLSGWMGGLKVTLGELAVRANAEELLVPQGSCLTSVAEPTPEVPPVLAPLRVVECPQ